MNGPSKFRVTPVRWIALTFLSVALAPPVFQLVREGDRLLTDPFFHVAAGSQGEDWTRRLMDVVRVDVVGPALFALVFGFVPAMLIALPAALAVSAGLLLGSRTVAPLRWRITWAVLGWITGFLAGPPTLRMLDQTVPHLPDDAAAGALCAALLHYLLHKQGAFGGRAS